MRLLIYPLAAMFLGCNITTQAQVFTITKTELAAGNVLLFYNLIDSIHNRTYTISVYSSVDNYLAPLTHVSGDVGLEVKPGLNRKITWNAKKELDPAFAGDVALEIRGKIYIPFVKLDGFNDYKKFKRNKIYKITWTGGRGNSVLNFDLYRGNKKVTSYPNVANVGEYSLKFQGVKPGKNYTFKISDSKNKDDMVITDRFKIKPKVPLLVKFIPVAAAAYLIGRTLNATANDDIPPPVKPGGN